MIKVNLKHFLPRFLIGLAITVIFAGFYLINFHPLEVLENKTYDYRFVFRGTKVNKNNVVIAAIDDESLKELGRWPWSRDIMAKLVDLLSENGAALTVFDVLFPEAEKNDKQLGISIYDAGNVIMPVNFDLSPENRPKEISGYLYRSRIEKVENEKMYGLYAPIHASDVLVPEDQLMEGAVGLGHINIVPDRDGVLRWDILVVDYGGYKFPNISVLAASYFLGHAPADISVDAAKSIKIGEDRKIPTDKFGRSLINYYGPVGTYKYLSVKDILSGKIESKDIEGKVVLIGSTAVGAYDLRVTPFSAVMPGIEKHANVINSIIDNDFIKKTETQTDILIILFTGVFFAVLTGFFRVWGASISVLVFVQFIIFGQYYVFKAGYWSTMVYPVFVVAFTFLSQMIYSYAVEEKSGRKIKGLFSSYVTKRVVEQLIKNPELAKLGGYRKEVSVLFSDIESFTSYSEKHTPEEVVAQLNEYLSEMTDVIMELDGTLDKFVGDEIMAFWGAPIDQEDHAERAVKCAVEMLRRLEKLHDKWRSEGRSVLYCGIGVNTGEVLVGNIGAESKKMDYTIIGDNVNLGARLEAITRNYDTKIVISEFTYEKIKGSEFGASVEELDEVKVKGKENSVKIYSVKPLRQ